MQPYSCIKIPIHAHSDPFPPHPWLNLINDLSNEELTSMIGFVRVVVSGYLQKLKKEGIIIARRGKLEIKDLHALVEKIEFHMRLPIPVVLISQLSRI